MKCKKICKPTAELHRPRNNRVWMLTCPALFFSMITALRYQATEKFGSPRCMSVDVRAYKHYVDHDEKKWTLQNAHENRFTHNAVSSDRWATSVIYSVDNLFTCHSKSSSIICLKICWCACRYFNAIWEHIIRVRSVVIVCILCNIF
jgi:hypothetical protein